MIKGKQLDLVNWGILRDIEFGTFECSKSLLLWTDVIKKQIDEKYLNEEKGTF